MMFGYLRLLCCIILLLNYGRYGSALTIPNRAAKGLAVPMAAVALEPQVIQLTRSPDQAFTVQLQGTDISGGSYSRASKPSVPRTKSEDFLVSLSMILVSEFGDKTFIIALLLSMKHGRLQVFTSAFSALSLMTIISSVLGKRITSFLPEQIVGIAAGVLFLVLGAQMLKEASRMAGGSGLGSEMQEVEEDLQVFQDTSLPSHDQKFPHDIEKEGLITQLRYNAFARIKQIVSQSVASLVRIASSVCSPFWVRTFSITILAEWGDRSQVSTMAMASGPDFSYVVLGAISGHLVCTGLAVLSGRSITGKVSMKIVTLCGAVSFLCFGVVYVYQGLK
ncbi:hypothetical protein BJ878DRAFT_459390 [Calycina marina]|uniref:GDT1 family protein n=1 Tax=Calycina marina TaxID=1763456 RepID=A0A9P7Z410_9HELO|nr:hypothetical protein BJ878DRAFT_459390 [Calycina marina]